MNARLGKTAASCLAFAACALLSCSGGPEPAGGNGAAPAKAPPAAPPERPAPPPDSAVGMAYTARSLELAGDSEGAVQAYRKALALDPGSPKLTISLSRTLYRAGRGTEALSTLEGFLDRKENASVRLQLIELLDALGRSDAARRAVRDVLEAGDEIAPAVARALSEKAVVLGDVPLAAEILARARRAGSKDPLPETEAGRLLLVMGYLDQARAYFEAALEKLPGGEGALGLAEILDRARDWMAAAEKALAYVQAHPQDVEGVFSLVEYLERAGELDRAVDWLEKLAARKSAPERVHLRLATLFRRLGLRDKALVAYRKAREAMPDGATLLYGIATLLDEMGRPDEAEALLVQAAREQRDTPSFVSHYLAYVWAKLDKNLAEAEAAAREALADSPDTAPYWAVLGYVLGKEDRMSEARNAFDKAMQGDPDPFVHRIYGEFLLDLGEKEEALLQFELAIKLDPRLEEVLAVEIRRAGG